MDGRKDGPTPVILVRFSGNPPAAPRRRKRGALYGRAPRRPAPYAPAGRGSRAVVALGGVPLSGARGLAGAARVGRGDLVVAGRPARPDGPASTWRPPSTSCAAPPRPRLVAERGDATLVAIEHASRAFGDLFDREVAAQAAARHRRQLVVAKQLPRGAWRRYIRRPPRPPWHHAHPQATAARRPAAAACCAARTSSCASLAPGIGASRRWPARAASAAGTAPSATR